jgi:hypothetical protein
MTCNVNEKLISLFSEIAHIEMVPLPRSRALAAVSDMPIALTRTGMAVRRSLIIRNSIPESVARKGVFRKMTWLMKHRIFLPHLEERHIRRPSCILD